MIRYGRGRVRAVPLLLALLVILGGLYAGVTALEAGPTKACNVVSGPIVTDIGPPGSGKPQYVHERWSSGSDCELELREHHEVGQ